MSMPSAGPWISPGYTGEKGLPSMKQPMRSVPPEMEASCTSVLIASYT